VQKFAVIGKGIQHSLSPIIHQQFAKQFNIKLDYQIIEAADDQDFTNKVFAFFAAGGSGLSVTSPFKQKAYELAKYKNINALNSKSGNTLWKKNNKFLQVENTDGAGLLTDLKKNKKLYINNKKLLILGCGGVVFNVINFLLAENPHTILIANRTKHKVFELINTLNLDNKKVTPFIEKAKHKIDLVLDCRSLIDDMSTIKKLVSYSCPYYNLGYTAKVNNMCELLTKNSIPVFDGLGMLVEQAALQFYLWHRKKPKTSYVLAKVKTQK
jgi:shikimate dehydrogenase